MSQVEPKHIRNSPRSTDGHQNSALKPSTALLAAKWSKSGASLRFSTFHFTLICSQLRRFEALFRPLVAAQ